MDQVQDTLTNVGSSFTSIGSVLYSHISVPRSLVSSVSSDMVDMAFVELVYFYEESVEESMNY